MMKMKLLIVIFRPLQNLVCIVEGLWRKILKGRSHCVLVMTIGAEKVPGANGRRGKLSLTMGNFVIPEKGTEIFS